jgi:hypothetical protein
MNTQPTATIVTAYTAPNGTRVAVVIVFGQKLTVRQTPKLTTTVWLDSVRVTKKGNPRAWHLAVEAAFAEWEKPAEVVPEWRRLGYATEEAYEASRVEEVATLHPEDAAALGYTSEPSEDTCAECGEPIEKRWLSGGAGWTWGHVDPARDGHPAPAEDEHRHVGYFDRNTGRTLCRHCDADLTETPATTRIAPEVAAVLSSPRVAAEAAWEEEAHAAGFASGDDYAAYLAEEADAPEPDAEQVAEHLAAARAAEPAPHLHDGPAAEPCRTCGRDRSSYLHSTLPPVEVPAGYAMRPAEPFGPVPVTNAELWR